MAVTKEEIKELITLKKESGHDDIFYKEIIKKKIINNAKIIHVIDNEHLDEDEPDTYVGVNIFPYYLLSMTQTSAQNYLCFETSFAEVPKYNDTLKNMQIIFYILCDSKSIYDAETGVARHDLLAALITDEFNYTNDFGVTIQLISDRPYAIDNDYVLRTLIFEQTAPNSLTKNGRVINRIGG